MSNEFIIPQKLSLWDYYRVSLYVGIRNKRLRWVFYFVIGVGVLNLFANLGLNQKPVNNYLVLILQSLLPLLILLLFFYGGSLIICFLIMRLNPGIFSNMTYQFTHWGMYKRSDTVDYSIPWRSIVKVKDTKSFIYLYSSNDMAHVIQKKKFRNNDELQSFKNIMSACLNQQ